MIYFEKYTCGQSIILNNEKCDAESVSDGNKTRIKYYLH